MKTLAIALAAVVVSACPAVAQTTAKPWAEKLFMNQTTHDFGTVARGAQLKHSFPIKNIYAVPLVLSDPRISCGCVSATLSKKTLQPQEEATLDVIMDTRKIDRGGGKEVSISVTVGPEYVSTATLHVKAFARTDVVFNPGEVNFGVIAQGQQPVQFVDLNYAGYLDFRVTEVIKPSDAPFNVTMQEIRRNPPIGKQAGQVAYRMTITLNADAPGGILKHDLVLKTNDPQSPSLSLGVDGNIQTRLTVAPNHVNFQSIKLGETKTLRVIVQGDRPFRITEIRTDGKEISADVPQEALKVHTLTLRCQPLGLGELRRTFTIITDMDKNASVTVTIQATATQ